MSQGPDAMLAPDAPAGAAEAAALNAPRAAPGAGPALDIRTLGAAFVRGPDGAVVRGLGAKSLAALVYVALSPGAAAPRDVLVDLLWSRGGPEQGRASLRQELRRMKRALGPLFEAAVDTPGGQIALRPGAFRCDALELERVCEAREAAGLAALLDLWGGPFLAPLAVPEAAFQDWQAERNSRFESLAVEGLLRLMLLDESAGRLDRATAAARLLLSMDPLQEDVHAAMVRLHVAAGRTAQARRHVESCRALFLEELGEAPETDLEALIPERGAGRAAAAAEATPAATARPARPTRPAGTGEGPARGAAAPDRPLAVFAAEDPAARAAAEVAAPRTAVLTGMRARLGGGEEADWRLTVGEAAPGPGEAAALLLAVAPRGGGAPAAARRVAWPAAAEGDAAAGLGPRLAATAAAELMRLETLGAERHAASAGGAWARLTAARAALADLDPARVEAARIALEADAREAPGEPLILAILGLTHFADGREGWVEDPRGAFFRARELALRAHRRAPDDPFAQHVLGLAAAAMGDPDGARLHQLRVLARHPGWPAAEGEMARLAALWGDVPEADARAARALETAPDDPAGPCWAVAPALARFARGDAAGALAALDGRLAGAGAGAGPAPRALAPDAPEAGLLRAAAALETGGDPGPGLAACAGRRARAASAAALAEALALMHPFAEPARTEALLAPLARG